MAAVAGTGAADWLACRFELSRGGSAANLRPMEGLRGFAVLLVFFVHFATLSSPWAEAGGGTAALLDAARRVGNTGVDLFFVLSGYLIYGHLISAPRAFGPYIRRRIRRIYPTFLFVFALYLTLSLAFPDESKLPVGFFNAAWYVALNLLLLPGLLPIEPMITVAWSLSYEMFYYLAMPAIIAVAALRGRPLRWRVIFFAAVLVVGLATSAWVGGPVRLSLFIAGVLLYESLHGNVQRLTPTGLGSSAALLALGAMAAVMLLPMPGPPLQSVRMFVLCCAFLVLCLVCLSNTRAAVSRAFCWTPLRWLGNMSYSYYLIHGLTLKFFFLVAAALLPAAVYRDTALVLLLPALAATLVASALLFVAVERPLSLVVRRSGLALPMPASPKASI